MKEHRYVRLAEMMRDAVEHPEKYPEVKKDKPAQKPTTEQKKTGWRGDWLKGHEDRQDNAPIWPSKPEKKD